jgi:hypothetical protein
MTRVPQIVRTPDIAVPALGDHPKPRRLPIWLRVVLEFCAGAINAIF